ncbi:hypothetical protein CCY99_06870 [Helicobacter sp. 16-1353]|uniref:hypothetical protein n=1 Tax=Helicobacter sp. 16-1353 TaxID=2004996 RepID=UPI000DCB8D68|nr:hypothetical protein [Helicobacter sp. 16-1353]RAX52689.1 hypothetical protein CCY99_06870 [Helicobacter sp. 16-1353]
MFRKIILSLVFFVITLNAEFIGEAGYGYNYYRYTEPGLMKIQGNLQSVFTKLGYLGDEIGLELIYSQTFAPKTKYFGSTMSGIPVNAIPSKDNFWNLDFRFGRRMNMLGSNYDGLAYIGVGYRYLKNNVQNEGGYTREQIYYYIPVGFYAIDGMGADGLSARYGAEFRYMFLGTNKTHIGEAIPSINPSVLTFTQKNNFGLKVYIGFEYEIAQSFKIFTQATADYWYVKDSNTQSVTYINNTSTLYQGYFVEPNNNTIQLGIEVGIGL